MTVNSVRQYGEKWLVTYSFLVPCGCYTIRRTAWAVGNDCVSVNEAIVEQQLKYENINKR